MRSFLERARRTLHAAGFSEDSLSEEYVVSCRSPFRERAVAHCSAGESVSQEILRAMQEGGFGTIAIGRRGVSKQEEFLFGSVSNRIIHYAKGCTVWVVN
jgi:nucleotide-binding universal stress UspA family protein